MSSVLLPGGPTCSSVLLGLTELDAVGLLGRHCSKSKAQGQGRRSRMTWAPTAAREPAGWLSWFSR